jgi:hypothetical protein
MFVMGFASVVYSFRPFYRRWQPLVALLAVSFVVGMLAVLVAGQSAQAQVESPAPEPASPEGEDDPSRLWVSGERLARHSCPSEDCGIVGRLFFRDAVTVLETRNGWVRVSEPYDAYCLDGRSQYVDEGRADCTADNGITDGVFAEWVRLDGLADLRPADPAEGATGFRALVGGSDDFQRYGDAFAKAAQELIADGRCTEGDFVAYGGFMKSANQPNAPIYFMYCGGATVANRLYLNAATGEVFR